MYKALFSFLLMTLLLIAGVFTADLFAQDARTSVQNVLGRLVPNRQLPTDLTITGQLTAPTGGVQPFRITIKGKDRVRYEIGTGNDLVTTIQSRGAGWTEVGNRVQLLEPRSAIRRPRVVPFLDLLVEADAPDLQITDRGNFSLESTVTRRFTLKLPDPAPNTRLFRKALDEETDVYVDLQTSLVVRSDSWITADNNPVARVQSILEFSDYRTVGGLAMPFRIRNTMVLPGQKPAQWIYTVLDVTVNSGVSDSIFNAEERSR